MEFQSRRRVTCEVARPGIPPPLEMLRSTTAMCFFAVISQVGLCLVNASSDAESDAATDSKVFRVHSERDEVSADEKSYTSDTDSDDAPSSAPSSAPSAVPSSAPSAIPSSMPSMSWHTDVSHTLPKSAFVKMGSTLATAVPVDLGWEETTAAVVEYEGCEISIVDYNCLNSALSTPARDQCVISPPRVSQPSCENYLQYHPLAPNIGDAAGTAEVYIEDPASGAQPVSDRDSNARSAPPHCPPTT